MESAWPIDVQDLVHAICSGAAHSFRGRGAISLAVFVATLACSSARVGGETGPSITMPARFLEGDAGADKEPERASADDARPADGGAAVASTKPKPASPPQFPPDPEALALPQQWEYVLRYDHGAVRVESVRLLKFEQPVVTSRQVGRWAFELWIGKELVDRVRFDFPLLGAEPAPSPRRPLEQPPTFAEGADVTRRILVPASPRPTRAVVVDRATGKTTEFPWPPTTGAAPPAAAP
jgi:hypothetical protein